MSTFLENQNWRYATKKFDATKKITDADIAFLKEAIRLSTSSYGLQPYRVFIVENPELRGRATHRLNCSIYKSFNENEIEIPYAKQDLYIKELP